MSFITNDVDVIVKHLKKGVPVGLPTETVYGLAADYSNIKAVEQVFTMKGRPLGHPLILHVLKEWDLSQWVDGLNSRARQLIEQFWPGPLSLVLPTNPQKINPIITGNQKTVAIRAPNHPMFMEVLRQFGQPLVAPSANLFEQISPTTAEHVAQNFKAFDLPILQGGRCQVGMESTIVRVLGETIEVLRPGQLDLSEGALIQRDPTIRVSGQLEKHYQPKKPFFYFNALNELPNRLENAYVMGFSQACNLFDYCFPESMDEVYYEFYYQIQQAEQTACSVILIELPPDNCGYHVIRDRIFKSSRPISEWQV